MFDVYVSGVDPNRKGEFEEIRKNVGITLKVEGETLDQIVNPKNNLVLIQENVAENVAIKVCKVLTGLGLVCSYQAVKTSSWGELSIVPIEETTHFFTCPGCNAQHEIEQDICPNCRMDIVKYKRNQKDAEEYEEIRRNLLLKSQARLENQKREQLDQEMKARKAQMEEKIANELGLAPKPGWKSFFDTKQVNKSYLIAVAAAIIGLTSYTFWPNKKVDSIADIPEASIMPEQTNSEQAVSAVADGMPENTAGKQTQAEQQPVAAIAQGEVPSTADIVDTKPTPNAQELVVQEGQTPAQAALGKGYSDVNKFLNSMGIDTGKSLAGAEKQQAIPVQASASPSDSAQTVGTAPVSASAQTVSTAPVSAQSPAAAQTPASVTNRLFLDSIYREVNSDAEWDTFILKKAKAHIKSGKLKSAYLLSQNQTNLSDHVDLISELLAAFSKLGRNDLVDSTLSKLNQRIQTQPQEIQAIYKSQLALNFGDKQSLFDDAEKLGLSIQDPVKQSQALSGIAVFQKMSGETQGSNNNFSRSLENLKKITPSFEQFSGYINLVNNYTKIKDNLNAEVSMQLAELSLSKLDATKQDEGLSMLLNASYLTNNAALINKYSSQFQDSALRSKTAFQSIQSQVKDSIPLDFSSQLTTISDADYSAVAAAFAALFETDTTKRKFLIDSAQQKLLLIQDNERKAVASSKVARYLYRLGNTQESLALFDQARSSALSIQKVEQRDAALISLAMDKARVFLNDNAEQLAGLINDNHLKLITLDMIKTYPSIKAVVTN